MDLFDRERVLELRKEIASLQRDNELYRLQEHHAASEARLGNRSFHCAITGPLFLIGGVMFLLSGVRMIHVDTRWVWPVLLIGIGVAFLLEWLHAKRSAS
jgi:fatty acid desaturase